MWGPPPPRKPTSGVRIAIYILGPIVLVILLLAFVGMAASSNGTRRTGSVSIAEDGTAPTTADHWHWAYGIYVCDRFLPHLSDEFGDQFGIHTHRDGIIHIHPFSGNVAGRRATLGRFFSDTGMTVSTTSMTIPAPNSGRSTTYSTCDGKPATVRVRIWDVDDPSTPVRTIDDAFGDIHFDKDRQAITIALVPAGKDILQPPSLATLDELTDGPTAPRSGPGTSRPGTSVPRATPGTGAIPASCPPSGLPAPPTSPMVADIVPSLPGTTPTRRDLSLLELCWANGAVQGRSGVDVKFRGTDGTCATTEHWVISEFASTKDAQAALDARQATLDQRRYGLAQQPGEHLTLASLPAGARAELDLDGPCLRQLRLGAVSHRYMVALVIDLGPDTTPDQRTDRFLQALDAAAKLP